MTSKDFKIKEIIGRARENNNSNQSQIKSSRKMQKIQQTIQEQSDIVDQKKIQQGQFRTRTQSQLLQLGQQQLQNSTTNSSKILKKLTPLKKIDTHFQQIQQKDQQRVQIYKNSQRKTQTKAYNNSQEQSKNSYQNNLQMIKNCQVEMLNYSKQFFKSSLFQMKQIMTSMKQQMLSSFNKQIKNLVANNVEIMKNSYVNNSGINSKGLNISNIANNHPQPLITIQSNEQSHLLLKYHQNYTLNYKQYTAETTKNTRQQQQNKYLIKLFSDVFSIGFNLLYENKIDFDKVKAYCCQNILSNIFQLIRSQTQPNDNLNTKEYHTLQTQLKPQIKSLIKMNNHIKKQILPYLKLQYPHSQQKQTNLQIKKRIISKDIFNKIQYDILYLAKIPIHKMGQSIQIQTNRQVMKVLNYLIETTDQVISQNKQKEKVTYFQQFEKDIKYIFQKIYSKQWTSYFYNISRQEKKHIKQQIQRNRKLQSWHQRQQQQGILKVFDSYTLRNNNNNNKQDIKYQDKQKQEYRQFVKSYTKFKIGRKISTNTQKFSDQQIQKGNLTIKNPTIARILTKWIQLLATQVKNPHQLIKQTNQFFCRDENRSKLFQYENVGRIIEGIPRHAHILTQMEEAVEQNFFEMLITQIKYKDQQRQIIYPQFCAQKQLLLGHASTILQKSINAYILLYLKTLIRLFKHVQNDSFSSAQVISFKLGDLMRCQILSKEREIIAIYEYICLLSQCYPNLLEILRVKDRLNGPNKDIMINAFYMGKIVIEIQLAIKNQSKFIECSDKYSHFIYELTRALIGPIGQLNSIWYKCSAKAQFFCKKFDNFNVYSIKNRKKHTYVYKSNKKLIQKDQHILKCKKLAAIKQKICLPFQCTECSTYIFSSQDRISCKYCQLPLSCLVCKNIQQATEFKNQKGFKYQKKRKDQQNYSFTNLIYGQNLLTQQNPQYYTSIYFRNQKQAQVFSFVMEEQQIQDLKFQFNLSQFDKISYAFFFYQQEQPQDQFKASLHKRIVKEYWVPQKLKSIALKKYQLVLSLQFLPESLVFDHIQILDCIFDYANIHLLYDTHTLIISDFFNNIQQDLQNQEISEQQKKRMLEKNIYFNVFILQQMPYISILKFTNIFLEQPEIVTQYKRKYDIVSNSSSVAKQSTQGKYQNKTSNIEFGKLQKLQQINLHYNSITNSTIKSLSQLKQIKIIQIVCNKLTTCQYIAKSPVLKYLNLSHNQIITFKGLPELQNLQTFIIANNKIQSFAYLSKLPKLKVFQLPTNMITNFKNFVRFQDLQSLDISDNKLQSLEGFPELGKLVKLCLQNNNLKSLKSFPLTLPLLKQLTLSSNKIKSLSYLPQLKNLQQLDISQNPIQRFSQLPKLSSLKIFNIYNDSSQQLQQSQSTNKSMKNKQSTMVEQLLNLKNNMLKGNIPKLRQIIIYNKERFEQIQEIQDLYDYLQNK